MPARINMADVVLADEDLRRKSLFTSTGEMKRRGTKRQVHSSSLMIQQLPSAVSLLYLILFLHLCQSTV